MDLKNRVYLVTGGSKGFGLSIAKALVARGARVGLLSRNPQDLSQAVTDIGGDYAYGVAADVGSSDQLRRAFAEVVQHFGRLDGLINNAGMAMPNPVENLIADEVRNQVNTNFLGTVFACQEVIPLLRDGVSDNPRIVNISSASAVHFDEMSHLSIYAASKAAVERFTRDLASECQLHDIGVTCVRPGGADSNIAADWDMDRTLAAFQAWRDEGSYRAVGMTAQEIAEAVVFCLCQPRGVSVDLLELRPQRREPKG